jgi:single-strand DNA-binding protein
MNKSIFIGLLGNKPELQESKGTKFARASLYISERNKDGEYKTVARHQLVFFDKLAESMSKWADKGRKVLVEAQSRTNEKENEDGTKTHYTSFIVEKIQFLDAKPSSDTTTREVKTVEKSSPSRKKKEQPVAVSTEDDFFE